MAQAAHCRPGMQQTWSRAGQGLLDAPPQQILRKDRGTGQILGDLRRESVPLILESRRKHETHDGREVRTVAQLPIAQGQYHCNSFPCLLRSQYHYTHIYVHALTNTCVHLCSITSTYMHNNVCVHTHTINIGKHTSSHRQTPLFPHTPAHTSPQPHPEIPELEFTDLHTRRELSLTTPDFPIAPTAYI